MLPGLHVTLASLLQSLVPDPADPVDLHLFLDRVNRREQERLALTHRMHEKGTRLHLHDFSPTAPSGANALHGNLTAYGRLHLPALLPHCSRCVYLDSDLVVNRSIHELFAEFDDEHVLLADGTAKRAESLDQGLFRAAGLDLAGSCFNSGVLGLNLALWRERNVEARCIDLAGRLGHLFHSADQSLLNTVLHDAFKAVGSTWNTPLYPTTPAVREPEARIYHFVGSPKPWDFLGNFLSNHFPFWRQRYAGTAIASKPFLAYTSFRRCLRISAQTARAWRDQARSRRAFAGMRSKPA